MVGYVSTPAPNKVLCSLSIWPAGPRIHNSLFRCFKILSLYCSLNQLSKPPGMGRCREGQPRHKYLSLTPDRPPTGPGQTPTNWRIPAARVGGMAPGPSASNAEDSGAPPRRLERAWTHRPAGNFRFRPQQGGQLVGSLDYGTYPSTVQSSSLSQPPIHRPHGLPPTGESPGHSPRRRQLADPGGPAGTPMSRPPTGESAPAEHSGLAPAGSPLPSRHPALPDPMMGRY